MAVRTKRPRARQATQDEGVSVYEVAPHPKGWTVQRQGGDGVESRHARREPAVREAHLLAQRDRPSKVVVLSDEGDHAWVVDYPEAPAEAGPERRAGIALLDSSGRPPKGELEA